MAEFPTNSGREAARGREATACVVKHAAVRAVIRGAGFATVDLSGYLRVLAAASGRDLDALIHLTDNMPFFMDGPRHLALRNLSSALLGPTRMRAWRPFLEPIVDRYVDRLATISSPDLIRDYCSPVFQAGIGLVLGIRDADSPLVSSWAEEAESILEPVLSIQKLSRLEKAVRAMTHHLAEGPFLHTPGAPRPVGEELLDHLFQGFEPQDAISLVLVLFVAGHSTSHTLGNILADILAKPADARAVAADPAWVEANIDVLLRLHAAPQFVRRVATRDQEVSACPFRAGDQIDADLFSANRDPAVFPAVSSCLDGGNSGSVRHLSFGAGLHKCPGATFARQFITVALSRLLARYPSLVLTVTRPERVRVGVTHYVVALPCHLSAEG